jgi:hypothetical protein
MKNGQKHLQVWYPDGQYASKYIFTHAFLVSGCQKSSMQIMFKLIFEIYMVSNSWPTS